MPTSQSIWARLLHEQLRSRQVPTAPELMQRAGLEPDPWQRRLLESTAPRQLLLCSRQSGKSSTCAALALATALKEPGSLVLLLSPSLRQSQELYRKVAQFLTIPVDIERESALRLELANGSRIISLPGTESTIRGYSGVSLLIVDEASRVLDELYLAVRPMLAVSQGRLVGLTTPWGKRGWFYNEYTGTEPWERTKITAYECPRISREFLEQEKRTMPPMWFAAEYLCEFTDTEDSVFSSEHIMSALSTDVQPLF